MDRSLIQLVRSGDSWTTEIRDISTSTAGLHFIIARNSNGEEKYPLVIRVRPRVDLSAVTECALDDGSVHFIYVLSTYIRYQNIYLYIWTWLASIIYKKCQNLSK